MQSATFVFVPKQTDILNDSLKKHEINLAI
jgi:hypothetical protein